MGFESFNVSLRGNVPGSTIIAEIPSLRPHLNSIPVTGFQHYILEEADHVFEIEVCDLRGGINFRFALCHPDSVIPTVIEFSQRLMTRFDLTANFESADFSAAAFSAAQNKEFAAEIDKAIRKRRAEWVSQFGPETMAVSTSEALGRFVLPLCQPVTNDPVFRPREIALKAR